MNPLFNRYISARFEAVIKHLNDFRKKRKPKSLHLLRIEIKRIRAVISFARQYGFIPPPADELTQLFRQAGHIRELLICIRLLRKLPEQPVAMINELRSEVKRLSGQFAKVVPYYTGYIEALKNKLVWQADIPGRKQSGKYFRKQIRKAEEDFASGGKNDLHRFRKRLKKMIYIYEFLPVSESKRLKINIAGMEKLQLKAGKWRDTYAALDYFSLKNGLLTDQNLAKLNAGEEKHWKKLTGSKLKLK